MSRRGSTRGKQELNQEQTIPNDQWATYYSTDPKVLDLDWVYHRRVGKGATGDGIHSGSTMLGEENVTDDVYDELHSVEFNL